jgi:hypothetical protein
MAAMAIDVDQVLSASDELQLELLNHCVYARRLEPLFVFLVADYRNHPSLARAHVLHQLFCRTGAPVRLGESRVLPPDDLRIERSIGLLPPLPAAGQPPVPFAPDRAIFDFIAADLRRDGGPLAALGAAFDPLLSAKENLPGGEMDAGQRAFVERVWRATVRPRLLGAGFWRVATLGG